MCDYKRETTSLCHNMECQKFLYEQHRRTNLAQYDFSRVVYDATIISLEDHNRKKMPGLIPLDFDGLWEMRNKALMQPTASDELTKRLEDLGEYKKLLSQKQIEAYKQGANQDHALNPQYQEFKRLVCERYNMDPKRDYKQFWELISKLKTIEELYDVCIVRMKNDFMEKFRNEVLDEMDTDKISQECPASTDWIKTFQERFIAKISKYLQAYYRARYQLQFDVSELTIEYQLVALELENTTYTADEAGKYTDRLFDTLPSHATVLNLSEFGVNDSNFIPNYPHPFRVALDSMLFSKIPPQITTIILPSAYCALPSKTIQQLLSCLRTLKWLRNSPAV